MKIALINENSQAAKNEMICATLKKVVEPMGHEVFNYGMCGAEDPNSLTYVQNGILAAVLLNSGAADFVITGCGTGEGAMLACNSFPKVLCGHIFEVTPDMLAQLVATGKEMGVEYNEEEYQKALPLLRLQMKALIARDLWDMNEYYHVINDANESIRKALELLEQPDFEGLLLKKR